LVAAAVLKDRDDDEDEKEVDNDHEHGHPVVPIHAHPDGDDDDKVAERANSQGQFDYFISEGKLASVRFDQLGSLV
jgi:hypothetical protein